MHLENCKFNFSWCSSSARTFLIKISFRSHSQIGLKWLNVAKELRYGFLLICRMFFPCAGRQENLHNDSTLSNRSGCTTSRHFKYILEHFKQSRITLGAQLCKRLIISMKTFTVLCIAINIARIIWTGINPVPPRLPPAGAKLRCQLKCQLGKLFYDDEG